MDTFNKFFVSMFVGSGDIVFIKPVPTRISQSDALILAAWLVAVADVKDEFPALLESIRAT